MKLSSRTSHLHLIRKHYKNWVVFIVAYVLGKETTDAVTRSGFVVRTNLTNLMGLAHLEDAGWQIRAVSADFLTITSPYQDVTLRCRLLVGGDVAHLDEIFRRRVYGGNFEGKVVLDIGMSNADSSIFFVKNGAELVIGIEPFPASFDLAEQNISLNHLAKKVIPVNAALASFSDSKSLFVSSTQPNFSSLQPLPGAKSLVKFDSSTPVRTITIPDLKLRYKLEKIDVLKLDCEGCEYDILGQNLVVDDISEIFVEFHGEGSPIRNFLSDNGYAIKQIENNILHASRGKAE